VTVDKLSPPRCGGSKKGVTAGPERAAEKMIFSASPLLRGEKSFPLATDYFADVMDFT
jgi:hypothetical protein